MNIYLLASEAYEDYHIISIFSDESLAVKMANRLKQDSGESFWVETYELDADSEHVRNDLYCYFVEMRDNGDVNQVLIQESYHRLVAKNNPLFLEINERNRLNDRLGGVGAKWMWIYVLAHNEQQAIEMADVKRVDFLSTGRWGEQH